jgi:hypothetical protein
MSNKLDDDSIMPWGMHKGKKMINVPAGYLLLMYEERKCSFDVKLYVEDNLAVLKKQRDDEKRTVVNHYERLKYNERFK